MTKDKRNRFRSRFSHGICKCFNIFTLCSRQSTSCIGADPSYENTFIISTPVIKQSNMHLSQSRIDYNHLKLSFYPTTFTSIDQKKLSRHLMPQIVLVDSDFCTDNNNMMRHVICQKEEPVSSFSSISSSPTSDCHLSLTIHQCYSTSTLPSVTTTNTDMLNKSTNNIIEKSSLPQTQTSSRFSYLIRPSTPCIFGRENYDDEQMNDDEFFLTAGGIVHSCPNIYELSIDNNRKLQSCDHLMLIDQRTKLNNSDNLNCYDTEFDRYSILPRFHSNLSSVSTDSIDSELKLYKERHAIGFSRPCHDNISIYSSFLPTTWRSDNYLLLMPLIHHQHSSLFNLIGHGKRSRSYDIPVGQTYSSVIV
ncbi:unnamed protein product [Rotaria sordida]|uniref:Uncharacterized protein n=1 Tax=Rotaria sordida TaxID=392033 RepID=A0A818Y0G3_9BILA|nr:unnamed protein product [Rotaria sordida]CAF3702664.1 unnamed protein product [Rotaria sordida]CAF3745819.1 unnamed protein product [Rotaria sordida]